MRVLGLALLVALGMQGAPGDDFYRDFRGQPFDWAEFKVTGPGAANLIKSEAEGLRITVPADVKSPVGLVVGFPVKGDFELTAGYEIIQADQPAAGYGVGFEIWLRTDTATKEATAFSRIVRPSGDDVYVCSRLTTNPQGRRVGIPGLKLPDFQAAGKSGQLRIKRTGSEVVLLAADEGNKEFREYYRFELGAEDIETLRLAANPGNAANVVDLRVRDFRLRSGDLPAAAKNQEVPKDGKGPTRDRTSLWLLAALLGAMLVIAGLLMWWRKAGSRAKS